MVSDDVLRALNEVGTAPPESIELLAGALSGSSVHQICWPGSAAVLKVTRRSQSGGSVLEASRREVTFYRDVAPRLPIATPRLLRHKVSADRVITLLTAHPPAQPVAEWDEGSWLAVADDLAALHRCSVPVEWTSGCWLEQALRAPDWTRATTFWVSRGVDRALLASLRRRTAPLRVMASGLERTLIHGDCHTDNLLRERHRVVWTDWQQVGIGNPALDLAFLSVRATPAAGTFPHEMIIRAYAAKRRVDGHEVLVATQAVELAILLFTWPRFAGLNTEAAVTRVARRVEHLGRSVLARIA